MLDKAEFTFTRSQKKGILLLILIILVAASSLISFSYLTAYKPYANLESDQNFAQPVTVSDSVIRLDINLADSAQWTSLKGIGPKLSTRIIRYRNSIGGFSDIKQISKVYGISPELFQSIQEHLYLNRFSAPQTEIKVSKTKKEANYPRLDINIATAEDFVLLPGINTTLARRIVKYRNSIGGFSQIEDLKRVYYLEPNTFKQIKPYLFLEVPASIFAEETDVESKRLRAYIAQTEVDSQKILGRTRGNALKTVANKRVAKPKIKDLPVIDLNRADSSSLALLPGLQPKLVLRIMKYRKLLGFFYSVDQLKHVYGLSPASYAQIAPFLQVNNLEEFPKKDINIVFARNLAFYPFIDKTVAESIVARRKEIGHFQSWDEVIGVPGVTSQILEKLRIYFEI